MQHQDAGVAAVADSSEVYSTTRLRRHANEQGELRRRKEEMDIEEPGLDEEEVVDQLEARGLDWWFLTVFKVAAVVALLCFSYDLFVVYYLN